MAKTIKIPKRLQAVLWSADISKLNIEKHKDYITHQVLIYGSFSDIRWLFKTYSKKEIANTFVNQPSKNYPREVFHFIKNHLLMLKDLNLNEDNYVTSILGPVRQRASRSF